MSFSEVLVACSFFRAHRFVESVAGDTDDRVSMLVAGTSTRPNRQCVHGSSGQCHDQ